MTGQLWYPPADNDSQRFDDDYAGIKWEGAAEKVCLHTTEGTGWPGYNGGSTAPNFTGKPNFSKQIIEWRQHFPANMSARALQNDSGGVETNKDKVIQVELIGTCDGRPKSSSLPNGGAHVQWSEDGIKHIYTGDAPDWWLREVAKLVAWCHEEHGVQLVAASKWLKYDDSYGNSSARMSGSTYNSFRGVLGHMHVAENSHGDPGNINIGKILEYAKGDATPEEDKIPEDDMFICNSSDNRKWLVNGLGKFYIETPDDLADLKSCGLTDYGTKSSKMLGYFATLAVPNVANLFAQTVQKVDAVQGDVDALQSEMAALKSAVDNLTQMVQQLLVPPPVKKG